MGQTLSVRCSSALFVVLPILFGASTAGAQQRAVEGAVAGIVASDGSKPVADATITLTRNDGAEPKTIPSGPDGTFRFSSLSPGLYKLTARRIGFRVAQIPSFRVVAGQTTELRVSLTASPTQLSTVEVRVTPTSIDASTTELARTIQVKNVELVPMGRDAASLVDLVPGASRGFVWGGGGDASNNYQLDGVSVNHPGVGGEFLSPSIDWIEALEIRGLGAGAEYGEFQGGVINAVTKTGSNDFRGSLRANYISPGLTGSNIQVNEEGAEQSMRRELSAEVRGPIVKDRLFYFLGGIVIDRDLNVPDLTSLELNDFRTEQQTFRDIRGIGKLTLLPSSKDKFDALFGRTNNKVERFGMNGLDDPAAALQVRAPVSFYELGWLRSGVTSSFDARLAGFQSEETRYGYEGANVPGVQIFKIGRQPRFQNAEFNERREPRNIGGNVKWSKQNALPGGENRFVLGAEYTRGFWENTRTRNGGLTWLPYIDPATGTVDGTNASTWPDVANKWGGEMHLKSDIEDAAMFIQDYLTILPGLTFTPGLRYGRWTGWLTPSDPLKSRFLAARHQAFDPRIGVVWDVSRRNDFVVKAHWGRYHQGMNSVFFDRAQGADVYSNERFYFQGPTFSDSRRVYTPAQRDAQLDTFTGFSPTFVETILNEAGAVENYRQPYVEQSVLSGEKKFGPRWKLELAYTNRVNRDIVGLVDRNLEENYSALHDVSVKDRITGQAILDQFGGPLVLPTVWISNKDLVADLARRLLLPVGVPKPTPGFTFADVTRPWNPDIALTTVGGARRSFNQLSMALRTEQAHWNGSASATYTRLRGNIAGLTGFGTTGTSFSAGSAVRPNEAINFEGYLPNFPSFESKVWLTGDVMYGFRAGVFATMSLGNYFAPSFQLNPRTRLVAFDNTNLNDSLFHQVIGQTILLEERGTRKYQPRTNLDLRLERRFVAPGFAWTFTGDLFNATASDAIIERNLTINDQTIGDRTSAFAAPRRRVNPVALQLGARVEF